MPIDFEFVSKVPAGMRPAVESLFFFNRDQGVHGFAIQDAVMRFGAPEIIVADGQLWLTTTHQPTLCLFALSAGRQARRPLAVALYARTSSEIMTVVHLAVDESFCHGAGMRSTTGLGIILIERIRRIAHQIRGIKSLELPYRVRYPLPVSSALISS